MGPNGRAASVQVVRNELGRAALKDPRQVERLRRVSEKLAARPDKGLPQVIRDASQLEGAYRFFSNRRVEFSMLLEAHAEQTRERARVASRVVVAHDSTEFAFGGERKELGRLSRKTRGFVGHFALAIDGARALPLGVVHCEPLVRGEQEKRRKAANEEMNEGLRWHRGAEAVHQSLPNAVHVMDRDADSYALLEEMLLRRQDFVVRLCYRNRRTDEGRIGAVAANARVVAEREVSVSSRAPHPSPRHRRRHPPRRGRTAKLEICAHPRAEILRPQNLGSASPRLVVNVVRVNEPQPPSGQEPVEWLLYTSLPVDSPEQVLAVVDAYRQRWLIEEFFKALKTGCAFEERQLESTHALVNLLAVSIPIAWHLLRLRTLARVDADTPASSIASPAQLACLRYELGRHSLPKSPTARQVLLAIAKLGGHLSNNGDPGWITLGRGYQDLLVLERGYLAGRRSDQS